VARKSIETMHQAQNALNRAIQPLRGATLVTPRGGWIHSTRLALGMSRAQLANRMGVTRARIAQLEKSEVEQALKLDTLRRSAEALNCTLVYAFVPNESYDAIVKEQARKVDSERIHRVTHTMQLENQPIRAEALSADPFPERELLRSGRLWNH